MEQTDVANLLKSFGFKDLSLVGMEGKNFTYKFASYNHQLLVKQFGMPALAAAGKVAVFVVPTYGKLGVSPGTHKVRLSYTGSHVSKLETDDSHLAKGETSHAIQVLYERARSSPTDRLALMHALWDFYNETKFASRMKKPKFLMSLSPKVKLGKNTRGYYQRGRTTEQPGVLWVSTRLFNAKEHFFNEVFLHEMCHQAVWCLDKTVDTSEGGHGPLWQAWMRKVGLDPRRYDPTEDGTYNDEVTQALKEEKNALNFGPRAPLSEIKKLQSVASPVPGQMFYVYEGRLFEGAFTATGRKYVFRGANVKGNKPIVLTFKGKPTSGMYVK